MWHFRVYAFGRAGTHILYEGADAHTWMADHAQSVRRSGWTHWELRREFELSRPK